VEEISLSVRDDIVGIQSMGLKIRHPRAKLLMQRWSAQILVASLKARSLSLLRSAMNRWTRAAQEERSRQRQSEARRDQGACRISAFLFLLERRAVSLRLLRWVEVVAAERQRELATLEEASALRLQSVWRGRAARSRVAGIRARRRA